LKTKDGKLKVGDLEKLVESEMKKARVRRERKDGSRQGQGQIWRQPGGNCPS